MRFSRCLLLLSLGFSFVGSACQARQMQQGSADPGSTPAQVRAILGEPTRTQEFLLPEVPFFGPESTEPEAAGGFDDLPAPSDDVAGEHPGRSSSDDTDDSTGEPPESI